MCGIAGLVALGNEHSVSPELLNRMTDSLAHRGPDGRGVWTGKRVGLGHRRLAIIDPDGGAQPWVLDDGRIAFVYNGELYNFQEIKQDLEAAGVVFRSRCDTEVVLRALLNWGVEKALGRFRGMFAFALWEAGPERLTLARDPIGVKPLYWAMRNGTVRFGSEIKAILADPAFPRSPDTTAVVNYLAHYRLSFRGQTLFRHIHEVPPGTFIQWEGKRRRETRFWSLPLIPEAEKTDPGPEKIAEVFRKKLTLAVKRRMIADVPVGAYLSGGIDSSVLVTLMRKLRGDSVRTFSIGFADSEYNEFSYAAAMARFLKVPHRQITLTEHGYFKQLEELICIKDTPLSVPNEVPLRFLSRVLKKSIRVVLSGEGADELLGGYSLLVRSPHDFLLAKALEEGKGKFSGEETAKIRAALERVYGTSRFASQREQFLALYKWTSAEERRAIAAPGLHVSAAEKEIERNWEEVWAKLDGAGLDPYEKVLHVLEEIHLAALLLRLDATTMAEGVEGRVPYTDIDLVEWAVAQPVQYKIRWKGKREERKAAKLTAMECAGSCDLTKYMLRLAFAGEIPDEILLRPKSAFPVPLDRWLFGLWQNWALERILTPRMGALFDLRALEKFVRGAESKDEGMKIWMLANLGIWLEMYFGPAR